MVHKREPDNLLQITVPFFVLINDNYIIIKINV